jgi:peptidoglycan hydrolase-like protein with peptidoglycan-binding domain
VRTLQLQSTNMTGPDVADWQTFLKNKSVFTAQVDGIFGPKSDTGTRSYQTGAGLSSDGVVGPGTMTKARADGYQSSTGASISGVDSNTNCSPFAATISAQGVAFVARYYSHNPKKKLTPAEAQALSAAGLSIVTVFEDSNNKPEFFSAAAGQAHAATALAQAAAVKQPAGTAIYFAVDFDASTADVSGPVTNYFRAVHGAFASAPTQYAVGVYGSGKTCGAIRDAKLATFTWLTGSMGFAGYSAFRTEAHIVQLAPQRTLTASLEVDDNIAQRAAFGSFRLA